MPNDSHAQFDQTVLEMIERSATGAMPHTPSYQDALKRLVASHQVYDSADHKGGHVSVRSLAALPLFHAQNLEAFLAGGIELGSLEADASIFSRYVRSLPEALRARAEGCRALVVARKAHHRAKHGGEAAHDPAHTLFLVPGAGPNPGLPGNYLHGLVVEAGNGAQAGAWVLQVHDSLDGVALCEVPTVRAAFEKLQEVLASAPFTLGELETLGFRTG